jgi:hypothetical protein
MKKPLPKLQSDDEAERFVAEANLTEYDHSGLRTVQFEFQPKSERLNLRSKGAARYRQGCGRKRRHSVSALHPTNARSRRPAPAQGDVSRRLSRPAARGVKR